jgi:alpha-D-ribose 1-methylphosphonate 5-phosphate C-P lyase
MNWLKKIKSLLPIEQKNHGAHGVQIGHVTGNVTILTNVSDDSSKEREEVRLLVKQVPWPPVCAFMEKTFNTRMVDALDKHQLYRLRRYVETMIKSGNTRANHKGLKKS